jgi:hypothetical protein
MLAILLPLAVLIVGLAIAKVRENEVGDGAESLLIMLGGALLALAVLALPCFRLRCVSFVNVEYPTLIKTLETARGNPDISPLELAAIQAQVLDVNETIADAKYWGNSALFGWYYTQAIMELEPVR